MPEIFCRIAVCKKRLIFRFGIVILLLGMHFVLAVTSIREKSPTFDETVHVGGGVTYWKINDYRVNPENGIFPQRWAALPLVCDKDIKFPSSDSECWLDLNEWVISYQFLYKIGNDPDSMFMRARIMIIILSVILGFIVYFWSWKLFGNVGAVISLMLYSFSPTVLAHARLVTSDLAAALAFIAAVWAIWSLLHRITPWRILLSSLAPALLFLSKMSAFLIIPMYLILIAVRLMAKTPLTIAAFGWSRELRTQASQLFAFILAGIVNVMIIMFCIWAFFGFRYSMLNDENKGRDILNEKWEGILSSAGDVATIVNFARGHRLLPEAYLYGFSYVFNKSRVRYAFLNGETRMRGWWYFFPYCSLVKTPFSVMFILFLAALSATIRWRDKKIESQKRLLEIIKRSVYPLTPLIVLVSIYSIFAVTSRINIGQRHVLLFYPAAFIPAGAVSYFYRRRGGGAGGRLMKILIPVLLLWLVFESMNIRPHYLAYFNQLSGGPREAYKHLVDSSLDWGQDLKGLENWLIRNKLKDQNQTEVYLSYFGTASIHHYDLNVKRLPCYYEQQAGDAFELTGGVFCISATMLQLVYHLDMLLWTGIDVREINEGFFQNILSDMKKLFEAQKNPEDFERFVQEKGLDYWRNRYRLYELLRLEKLCRYLQRREPDDNVGYSILIYRLTDKEIDEAMKEIRLKTDWEALRDS